MNKKVIALLLISISAIAITACSNKNNIDTIKNNTPTKIEDKTKDKTKDKTQDKTEDKTKDKTEVKEKTPNRYSIAGIDDAVEFERAFKNIQLLVAKGEKEKVAEYISYPLVGVNNKITTKAEFIKNYDSIITKEVKNALVNQKVEETVVNYKGVMVDDGKIWFAANPASNSTSPKYIIFAINQ